MNTDSLLMPEIGCGVTVWDDVYNKKESNMNSVKMILSDGKDQLVKIIDMTDIMVEYLSTDKKIMILSRDMPVNSLTLADSQWYASVGFKRKEESDECMSKAEFMELVNDGWTFKGE